MLFWLAGWCVSCTKEVLLMQLHTQHWHVAVTYPGYRDGYEDRAFEDIDGALDYANQAQDTFREDGHTVTEVDSPEDDVAGVIRRYEATEEKDATIAVVEVRPCHQATCLPGRSTDARPAEAAGSWPPLVQSRPVQASVVGSSTRAGRSADRALRLVAERRR
jgi:hypothetical protein